MLHAAKCSAFLFYVPFVSCYTIHTGPLKFFVLKPLTYKHWATAAMATKFPDCTPGLMSHLLTVLRAYSDVEDPAWRLYDIAYREKMAATGQKQAKRAVGAS